MVHCVLCEREVERIEYDMNDELCSACSEDG